VSILNKRCLLKFRDQVLKITYRPLTGAQLLAVGSRMEEMQQAVEGGDSAAVIEVLTYTAELVASQVKKIEDAGPLGEPEDGETLVDRCEEIADADAGQVPYLLEDLKGALLGYDPGAAKDAVEFDEGREWHDLDDDEKALALEMLQDEVLTPMIRKLMKNDDPLFLG